MIKLSNGVKFRLKRLSIMHDSVYSDLLFQLVRDIDYRTESVPIFPDTIYYFVVKSRDTSVVIPLILQNECWETAGWRYQTT